MSLGNVTTWTLVPAEFTAGKSQKFSFCLSAALFWPDRNPNRFNERQNDAFRFSQLHEVDWFPLKCKNKDGNAIKDPLRSVAVAVTAAFVPVTGSEGAGGNRRCMVQGMVLLWFWWRYADSLSIWLQRYSVAVYLVRVFTAADLFSQLKHCSVESAERCRERSKCRLHTHTHLCCNSSAAFVWLISDNTDHCFSCSRTLCL